MKGVEVHGKRPGRLVALAALILLSGCASIHRARETQRGGNLLPGEKTATAAEAGLTTNAVLGLERALELALAANPSIFIASQQVVMAEARWRQAKSAFWPNLGASAGYSKSGSGGGDTADSWSAGLSMNLLVYDFGRTPASARQAILGRVIASENFRAARSDLVYSVKIAFLELCKALELQKVAGEAVRQYELHAEQAETYRAVGNRTAYDVTKAQLDLANARMNLVTASNSVSDARAQLNSLLGLAEDPAFDAAAQPAVEYAGDFTNMFARACSNHPDMRKLQAQVMVASAGVDIAIADVFPDLSLSARYAGGGAGFPLDWSWSSGLSGAMSLFTGWRQTAAIDLAAAELRVARASLAARHQGLYLELRKAVNRLEAARQKQELADLAMRQARETADILEERYKVGSATAVELTDAQAALVRAKSDRVNARFDCEEAWAQALHLTGEER